MGRDRTCAFSTPELSQFDQQKLTYLSPDQTFEHHHLNSKKGRMQLNDIQEEKKEKDTNTTIKRSFLNSLTNSQEL